MQVGEDCPPSSDPAIQCPSHVIICTDHRHHEEDHKL